MFILIPPIQLYALKTKAPDRGGSKNEETDIQKGTKQ